MEEKRPVTNYRPSTYTLEQPTLATARMREEVIFLRSEQKVAATQERSAERIGERNRCSIGYRLAVFRTVGSCSEYASVIRTHASSPAQFGCRCLAVTRGVFS